MIAEIFASMLVAASPAPTASPAQQPGAPVRTVVYKVTTSERADDITESYGGGPNASLPSTTALSEGHGTVTVDVMAKFEDGVLGIKIAELWSEDRSPEHFTGAVAPDGTVEFPSATISPVTIELLSYFATQFAPKGTLAVGTRWSVNKASGQTSVMTGYTVTAVGSDSVTIHKDMTIKSLGKETVDGTIIYEQSLLAPISGDIRVRRTDMFADGQVARTIELRFDRVSDTFGVPLPQ